MQSKSKVLKTLLTVMAVSTAMAQVDEFEVFDSEQIDVDGIYKEKPKPTAADRIRNQRQALEKKNEELVRKKIEDARIKEEQRMTKRLSNLFEGKGFTDMTDDSVSTSQAAPVQTVQKEIPMPASKKTASITLGAGMTNYMVSQEDNIADNDYTTSGDFNLSLDGMVIPQVELGLGFGYKNISFEDNPYNIGFGSYSSFYRNGYQARKIDGRLLSVDLHGRFVMTRESKVKPYIGAGVAYNRINLEYESNDNSYIGSSNFYNNYGSEEYTSSFLSAGLNAGLAFDITDTFGLAAQVQYMKGFGGDNEDTNQQFLFSNFVNDQRLLENVGAQIENSDAFDISVGVRASF